MHDRLSRTSSIDRGNRETGRQGRMEEECRRRCTPLSCSQQALGSRRWPVLGIISIPVLSILRSWSVEPGTRWMISTRTTPESRCVNAQALREGIHTQDRAEPRDFETPTTAPHSAALCSAPPNTMFRHLSRIEQDRTSQLMLWGADHGRVAHHDPLSG